MPAATATVLFMQSYHWKPHQNCSNELVLVALIAFQEQPQAASNPPSVKTRSLVRDHSTACGRASMAMPCC